MLISWMYGQVKRGFAFSRYEEDATVALSAGIVMFIAGAIVIALFGNPLISTAIATSVVLIAGVSAFTFSPNASKKTYALYIMAFCSYVGLITGLLTHVYPPGLPLLIIILVGEEAIFFIDNQKRPAGVGVLSFTAVKKLDSVNDVFIGLGLYGLYGLVYQITGGIQPAIRFFISAQPYVAYGIIIIGGAVLLLMANSFKYGGPHASEVKTPPAPVAPETNSQVPSTTAPYDPKTLEWKPAACLPPGYNPIRPEFKNVTQP